MAYQAGASLGQFWDAMLKLRGQRLQEQEIEAKLAQQRQEQMMQMAQQTSAQIGSALLGSAQTAKTDRIANRLMNQISPPRAEAADPQLAAQMSKLGLGPTEPFTGGAEELKMQMELSKQLSANYAQKALGDQRRIAGAARAMSMTSKPFQDSFRNITGYTSNIDTLNESINKAIQTGDKQLYDNSAQAMNALHKSLMETNPKSEMPPPVIPPFVTQEQQRAILEAQTGIQSEQQALGQMQQGANAPPSFFGLQYGGPIGEKIKAGILQGRQEAITAQQEKITELDKAMKALPGAKEYFSATPQARASAGAGAVTGNKAGQVVNGWPLGTKRINPQTGEIIIWDGTGWKKPE